MAALAIPRFAGTQEVAKKRAHNANVRTIESAISLYSAETGTALADIDNISDLIDEYLKEIPTNPMTKAKDYTVLDGSVSPVVEAVD